MWCGKWESVIDIAAEKKATFSDLWIHIWSKLKKYDHLLLVYHFTAPLINFFGKILKSFDKYMYHIIRFKSFSYYWIFKWENLWRYFAMIKDTMNVHCNYVGVVLCWCCSCVWIVQGYWSVSSTWKSSVKTVW